MKSIICIILCTAILVIATACAAESNVDATEKETEQSTYITEEYTSIPETSFLNETIIETTEPTTQLTTQTMVQTTTELRIETTITETTKETVTKGVASGYEEAFNNTRLNPVYTNWEPLDSRIQSILRQITSSSMTVFEQVRACYDYIIGIATYGTGVLYFDDDFIEYYSYRDTLTVLEALDLLNRGIGVCDNYTSLFVVMTRALGLESYFTGGKITNTSGVTSGHAWATITVDGVDYIFDPQVEDKQSANGIKYTFFCKTYDSSIGKIYSGYNLAQSKSEYGGFRYKEPIYETEYYYYEETPAETTYAQPAIMPDLFVD